MSEEKIQSGWELMLKITGALIGFIAFCILIKYLFGI
jgi:hypothetical protein